MTEDALLLLAFTRCNAPARTEEWSDWYDEVHLPSLAEVGFDVVTRFELTQQPVPGMPSIGFSHLALYEFRGAGAAERVDSLFELDRDLERAGKRHPNHSVIDVDLLQAHGRPHAQAEGSETGKSDPSSALRGHILAYVMSNQVQRAEEWDRWYDDIHLPDMMASGAFLAGSRWRRKTPKPYAANDLTLYDVAGRSVEEAVEQSAAVMPGIAAAGRKLDCHVGAMSFTVRPCGKHGGAGYRQGSR